MNLVKAGGEQFSAHTARSIRRAACPRWCTTASASRNRSRSSSISTKRFPDHRLIPKRSRGSRARAHALADHRLRHPAAAEHEHHEISERDAAARRARRSRRGCGNGSRAVSTRTTRISRAIICPASSRHGDTPTMADCCLVPQLYAASRFGVEVDEISAARADRRELRRVVRVPARAPLEAARCPVRKVFARRRGRARRAHARWHDGDVRRFRSVRHSGKPHPGTARFGRAQPHGHLQQCRRRRIRARACCSRRGRSARWFPRTSARTRSSSASTSRRSSSSSSTRKARWPSAFAPAAPASTASTRAPAPARSSPRARNSATSTARRSCSRPGSPPICPSSKRGRATPKAISCIARPRAISIR